MSVVLILGSAPIAVQAAGWSRDGFDAIVAINNAHRIRPDWDFAIFPWDFAVDRRPVANDGQHLVTEAEFVPAQNAYGGFVYAGATMAYTAAYWALAVLRPTVIAMFGCDMHYPAGAATHFYGAGSPDPLRDDITLRSLEAKSARLMVLAAKQGCAMINLSQGQSRLIFPRGMESATNLPKFDPVMAEAALRYEADLNYISPSGRYWEELDRFVPAKIDALDAMWLATV